MTARISYAYASRFRRSLLSIFRYVHCVPIQAHVYVPSQLESGQKVNCTVTITNKGTSDYFLFYRGTPLEGLMSDIFRVTRNGSPVPYDGPFFKRSAVQLHSTGIELKANDSVSVNVDLTTAYSLSDREGYAVSLNTRINVLNGDSIIQQFNLQSAPARFVVDGSIDTGSKMTAGAKHRLERSNYKLEAIDNVQTKGTPLSVTFGGSYDSVDASEAKDAWSRAYSAVTKGISVMTSNPSHYEHWFGLSPSVTPAPWSGTYASLQTAMEKSTFRLYFRGPYCKDGVFAYTYFDSDTIYLCDGYIRAPIYGYNSKFGTIVHEMTHAVARTQDLAYGVNECRQLALKKPYSAIMNADNYEFFAETL